MTAMIANSSPSLASANKGDQLSSFDVEAFEVPGGRDDDHVVGQGIGHGLPEHGAVIVAAKADVDDARATRQRIERMAILVHHLLKDSSDDTERAFAATLHQLYIEQRPESRSAATG